MTEQPSISKAWDKFLAKFHEIDTLSTKDWKQVHLLSYFTRKYKEQFGIDYSLKFNTTAPGSSFEIFQINRLRVQLTSDPVALRNYIDWIFQDKANLGKRRFTSISFLTKEEFLGEYKRNVLFASAAKIDRSTPLPEHYSQIFAGMRIKTYGDLAFLSQMSSPPPNVKNAFAQLDEQGFDKSILGKIV
jgi:hypothetical protein